MDVWLGHNATFFDVGAPSLELRFHQRNDVRRAERNNVWQNGTERDKGDINGSDV